MLSPILALFARISKPLWLNIHSTGAEVAGRQKTFSSNICSTSNVSLCATSTQLFCPNFTLHEWRRPSLHGPKSQDQDWDRDSRVPRPRFWGSMQRPRPRLVKTGLETKTQVSRTPSLVITKLSCGNPVVLNARYSLCCIGHSKMSVDLSRLAISFMILVLLITGK